MLTQAIELFAQETFRLNNESTATRAGASHPSVSGLYTFLTCNLVELNCFPDIEWLMLCTLIMFDEVRLVAI
jgi:hypothetical protein